MELLRIEGLTKSYEDTKVLSDVSFCVERGEILAITGASGSGKTTLLRCLNFLEPFDQGKVYLDGGLLFDASQKYSEKELRQKRLNFGFVFQAYNLFPQYTALKNVSLALNYFTLKKKIPRAQKKNELIQNRLDALGLLEKLGLKDKAESYPFQLSGGQLQRVAIARALALKPTVLCFDEPTSALDPSLTGEVINIIESLKTPQRAILIITHDPKVFDRYKTYNITISDCQRVANC